MHPSVSMSWCGMCCPISQEQSRGKEGGAQKGGFGSAIAKMALLGVD